MKASPEQSHLYPGERGARSLLLIALVLVVLPQLTTVDLWVLVVFVGIVFARLIGGRAARIVSGRTPRMLLFLFGVVAVFSTHNSLLSLNAGLSFLLLLLTLKVMESRTAREFSVMATLGCFMCVSNLFISQTLLAMVYQIVILLMFLASLARQNSGGSMPIASAFRSALRMLTLGLPVAAVLFVFVPRQGGAFRINLQGKDLNLSGISDTLSAGSFSEVTLSTAVAFRANFREGRIPESHQLYWRTNVLFEGNAFDWWRGSSFPPLPPQGREITDVDVFHRITLEPHGGKWLPALDRPIHRIQEAYIEAGYVLFSRAPIYLSRSYDIHSRPGPTRSEMNQTWQRRLTTVPPRLGQRVVELANSLRQPDAQTTVRQILKFFRTGGFAYTLSPGPYTGAGAMEEFLFDRRKGYCEHYAAACATLLRAAGVPARIVVGYQGGELNAVGSYVIVRQSDAHAWCEAWIENDGWTRVDPTLVVAPDRISAGFVAFMDSQTTSQSGLARFAGQVGIDSLFRSVRLLWDTLDYYWTSQIVSFDETTQATLLALSGIASRFQTVISLLIAAFGLVFFVMTYRLLGQRSKRLDPAKRQFEKVRRTASARGFVTASTIGPMDFIRGAASVFPNASQELREFGRCYIRDRYEALPPATGDDHHPLRPLARQAQRGLRRSRAVRPGETRR